MASSKSAVSVLNRFDSAKDSLHRFSWWVNWAGGICLIAMMLLICTNIISRLFNKPVTGVYEIVGFLLVLIISFSLAYGAATRCHIAVDLVTRELPQRVQAILESIVFLISLVLFGIVSWRCVASGMDLRHSGDVSATLGIHYFPLLYAAAFGFALTSLVIIFDFIKSVRPEGK